MPKKKQTPAADKGLNQRIEDATESLLTKFQESLSQINRRPVQIKEHFTLPDKGGTRDVVRTEYEEGHVDVDALERLAATLKTIRQSASMKVSAEESAAALTPLLALTDEQKEEFCQ